MTIIEIWFVVIQRSELVFNNLHMNQITSFVFFVLFSVLPRIWSLI